MRNNMYVAPAEKTPDRIRAGQILKQLRTKVLGHSSQQAWADAIGISVRQVAAAESGEHIGPPTKRRLEDGLGWARGDWDRFVDTGQHPPVIPGIDDPAAPRVVQMSPHELALTVEDIESVQGRDAAQGFFEGAIRIRGEWAKRARSSGSVSAKAADDPSS